MIAVFLGPSLPADEARALLPGAALLPPARQGDVWRALERRPRAIVLIDGVFESQPSVWHHEILAALDAGVPVLGAASMGALRAAELAAHGMRGVGRIFERYRAGTLVDDSEVALLHADAEHGFRPLTVPLVNVRYAAEAARRRGALTLRDERALLAAAEAIFYQERTWPAVLARADLGGATRARWERFARRGLPDLKAEDARACLRAARRLPRPRAVQVVRPVSAAVRRARLLQAGRLRTGPRELAEAGLRRLLLAAFARALGLVATGSDRAAAERRWLAGRARGPFLARMGLDDAEARRVCETLALEKLALDHAERLVPDGPSLLEGLALESRVRGLSRRRDA